MMLLSDAMLMRTRNAAEVRELSWEEVQGYIQRTFFAGEEFPVTQHSAERLSPIAAAHRILTNSMSVLPVGLYRKADGARHPESDPTLDVVLKVRANERMSPSLFRKILMSQAFWHGAGYAWIQRDGAGRVRSLLPLPSSGHQLRRDPHTGAEWHDFTVDGMTRSFQPSELIIVFFDSYDGKDGRGMLALARDAIATEGASQQYGKKFYESGGRLNGVVHVDTDLKSEGRERVRKEFARHAGDAESSFRVAVLDRGFTFTPIGLSQSDAQYVESRNFSVDEVCRFTGVPQYMLQSGKQSYNSNEQQQLDFATNTLLAHVTQWEQEWSYKLLSPAQLMGGWYAKFNLGALLRGDNESRSRFYEKMIFSGVYCPDDCRAFEEMNPLPGGFGQQFFMTKNLATVEQIAKGLVKGVEKE